MTEEIKDRNNDPMAEDFPTKAECGRSIGRKRHLQAHLRARQRKMRWRWYELYGGLSPVGSDRKWTDEDPAYIRPFSRGKRSKKIKRVCNKKFRRRHRLRMNEDLSVSRKRGLGHKETEYWWELD